MFNQQNGKIISRRPARSDHIIISSCSLWRRMGRKLGQQPCIAQPNPSTVLKRNYAIKQQMSLFWMEPALGDAVISSVRSESRSDSSHQKACLLKISHMTAGWRRLLYRLVTRLLPLAVVLCVNGLVSLCRQRGSCCA